MSARDNVRKPGPWLIPDASDARASTTATTTVVSVAPKRAKMTRLVQSVTGAFSDGYLSTLLGVRERMGAVVDAHQLLDRNVGVLLRRRQLRVTEELLDAPQVGVHV